jgi:prepilin-type N-terminal cleavage/methylation domain-containing protein
MKTTSPSRGFTLLETVISLGVFGLCFSLVLPFLSFQRALWSKQQAFREEHGTLSSSLRWLARDLQEAGYRSSGPAVTELSETSLTYALSRDEDEPTRFSAGNRRLVSVYLRGEDLMYRIRAWDVSSSAFRKGSVHTLASGLKGVVFRALDAGGDPVTAPDDIISVEIVLVGKRSGTHSCLVTIRNRRGRREL